MLWRHAAIALAVLAQCFVGGVASARAQGLIWELPPEGTLVHYEGTITQTDFRLDAPGAEDSGDVTAQWIGHLTIKSLKSEMAEFNGKMQSCRWLEFVVATGKSEEGLNAGPVGERIYKVLVPESRVIAAQVDAENIPVAFLPIVKGYRKLGNKDATPIESNVLQVYPLIALVIHHKSLKPQGEANDLEIRLGEDTSAQRKPVKATKLVGVTQMERASSRSKNESTLWRSTDVPFGLAKWEVTQNLWSKEDTDPPDAFKQVSKVQVEMHAVYQQTGAQADPRLP
ncbi:MAG: hypothetical protein WD648_15255 [Planctomycetaceae bacterium]